MDVTFNGIEYFGHERALGKYKDNYLNRIHKTIEETGLHRKYEKVMVSHCHNVSQTLDKDFNPDCLKSLSILIWSSPCKEYANAADKIADEVLYKENWTGERGDIYKSDMFMQQPEASLHINVYGVQCAEFYKNTNTLYILNDLFHYPNDINIEIFHEILKKLDKFCTSFEDLSDEEKSKQLEENIKQFYCQQLDMYKEQHREVLAVVQSAKSELISSIRNRDELQNRISLEQQNYLNNIEKVFKEMKLINILELIDFVNFIGNNLEIYTKELFIPDENDDRYKYIMGSYLIRVDLTTSMITFLTRDGSGVKGLWTDNDPHPHVNGENGNACFGNIECTIAQLCGERDLYALTMVLLDFLQSANLDDSAGKHIVAWDKIDKDGNIVPGISLYECAFCGFEGDEEDDIVICTDCNAATCRECGIYIENVDEYVCQRCCEDSYSNCEICNTIEPNDSMIDTETHAAVCGWCYERYFGECNECDKIYHNDDLTEYEGELYCNSCYDIKITQENEEIEEESDEVDETATAQDTEEDVKIEFVKYDTIEKVKEVESDEI